MNPYFEPIASSKGRLPVPVVFYVNLLQIVISVALIVVILIQAKGSGLGSIFGGDSSIYKTRRGVEKTLYQATIGLAVAFFAMSIVSVLIAG
jgi:preprotein translocase subunit SecG